MAYKHNDVIWKYVKRHDYGVTKHTNNNQLSSSQYIYEDINRLNFKWLRDGSGGDEDKFEITIKDNYIPRKKLPFQEKLYGFLYNKSGSRIKKDGQDVKFELEYNYIDTSSNDLNFCYFHTDFIDDENKKIVITKGDKLVGLDIEFSKSITENNIPTGPSDIMQMNVTYVYVKDEYYIYDSREFGEDVTINEGFVRIYTKNGSNYTPVTVKNNYYIVNGVRKYFIEDEKIEVNDIPITLKNTKWEYNPSSKKVLYELTDSNLLDRLTIENLRIAYACKILSFTFKDINEHKEAPSGITKIPNVFKGILDYCKIRIHYKQMEEYDTYELIETPDIIDPQNIIDSNKIAFSYTDCLSGTCYRYINDSNNIYEYDIEVSDGMSLENYYNEFDLIDNEVKNMINVDFVIDWSYNLMEKMNKIHNEYVNIGCKILLINQEDSKQNGIYIKAANNYLEKTDYLNTREQSEKFSAYCSYGVYQDKQFFLKPISGIFPTMDEAKTFEIDKSLIVKNTLDYNINNYTGTPKMLFVDEHLAKKQVEGNGINYQGIELREARYFNNFYINKYNESIFEINTNLRGYTGNDVINITKPGSPNLYPVFKKSKDYLLIETRITNVINLFHLRDLYDNDPLETMILDIKYNINSYQYSYFKISTSVRIVEPIKSGTTTIGYALYVDAYNIPYNILTTLEKNKNKFVYEISNLNYIKGSNMNYNRLLDIFHFSQFDKIFDFEMSSNTLKIHAKGYNYVDYIDYGIQIRTSNPTCYLLKEGESITHFKIDFKDLTTNSYLKYNLYDYMKMICGDKDPNTELGINVSLPENIIWNDSQGRIITKYIKTFSGSSDQQTGNIIFKIIYDKNRDIFKKHDLIDLYYDSSSTPIVLSIDSVDYYDNKINLSTNINEGIIYTNRKWKKIDTSISINRIVRIELSRYISRFSNYMALTENHVLRHAVSNNVAKLFIKFPKLRNKFTGIIYPNVNDKYMLNIFDNWEEDKNLLYKPSQLIRIGANKETAMPLILNYLSVENNTQNDFVLEDKLNDTIIKIDYKEEYDVFSIGQKIKINYDSSKNIILNINDIWIKNNTINLYVSLPMETIIGHINNIAYNINVPGEQMDDGLEEKIIPNTGNIRLGDNDYYILVSFMDIKENDFFNIGCVAEIIFTNTLNEEKIIQSLIEKVKYIDNKIFLRLNIKNKENIQYINKLTCCKA